MDPNNQLVHTFNLDTEVGKDQLLSFPRFIREKMAFGQLPGIRMEGLEALVGHAGHYVEFKAGPQRGRYDSTVRIYLTKPLRTEVWSVQGRDQEFEKQLENVLLFSLQFFEEHVRESMIYLAFVPGSPKTAEARARRSLLKTLLSGNLMNLFLLSILVGVAVYATLSAISPETAQVVAPIFLISFMLALSLSAGRLSSLRSPWRITKDRRDVLLVQYKVPEGQLGKFVEQNRARIVAAKKRAYDMFLACPGDACGDKIADVFLREGIPAEPKDFTVRRIDVYGMVERIARKFGISVPAIVIMQDAKPNAAATGFTKNLATMIITMGLLVQLEDEEIELVIGHELSHLRSGDPIILFSLVATEYLARVFVFGTMIPAVLFFPYIIFVLWAIFFFGKFLESRADLEAGIILGKPKVMAESLKKIGFRRLVLEERFLEPGASRFNEWLRLDAHPPMYFRIQRLESLDIAHPPKHPFLSSVRAVTRGFINAGKVA